MVLSVKFLSNIQILAAGVLLLTCISCRNEKAKPKEEDLISLNIHDTLATITFPNTLKLDTSYTWTDSDDTNCSSFRKTRYHNKSDSVYMETGTFHKRPPKYKAYLTFQTAEYSECLKKVDPLDFEKQSKLLGHYAIIQSMGENLKLKKVIGVLFTNTKQVPVYVTGYIAPTWRNVWEVSFSAFTYNPRNNMLVNIHFEKTMTEYDPQFSKSCMEILSNLDIH